MGCGPPLLKGCGKLMIGHDDMSGQTVNAVHIVKKSAKDGIVAYLEQRFRKILCERIETRGISGCNNDGLHQID